MSKTGGATYEGYYFQVGNSFRLVGIAILDSSKLSGDLRVSMESRLASIGRDYHCAIKSIERETPAEFPEWMTALEIDADNIINTEE